MSYTSTQSCVESISAVQVKLTSQLCSYELQHDENVACATNILPKIDSIQETNPFLEAQEQQMLDPLFVGWNPWATTAQRDT